jgi:hypothetical protein
MCRWIGSEVVDTQLVIDVRIPSAWMLHTDADNGAILLV